MRLKVLIILVAVLLCGSLSALDIYAGGKIGPGAAFVYGDDTDDVDPKAGMSLGVYGMFAPIKFLAVQAEFNYEIKGFSFSIGDNEDGVVVQNNTTQHTHYISIPILVKGVLPVSLNSKFGLTILPYAGLNFSFLANANYTSKFTSSTVNFTREKDNKEDFEIFDMGVLFGVEIFFNITKNIFVSADLRFELNFLKIDSGRNADIYNGAFYALFGAGYKF